MSYVDENLTPGEQVLYKTGLHGIVLVPFVIVGLFFGLFGLLMVIAAIADTSGGGAGAAGGFGFVLLVFGGLIVLLGYLKRKATEMAVTNKRVLIKTGLLSRKTLELLLTKVESIGVEEGALGRMFGYGSVVVRGIGGTPEPFKGVRSPLEFRKQVQQLVEAREQELQGQKVRA